MIQPFIKANTVTIIHINSWIHIYPGYDTRDSWCVALVYEIFALKVSQFFQLLTRFAQLQYDF